MCFKKVKYKGKIKEFAFSRKFPQFSLIFVEIFSRKRIQIFAQMRKRKFSFQPQVMNVLVYKGEYGPCR
jgi:hypothetical protein